MLTIADVAERDLIARIRSRSALPQPAWVTVGIGDDAAVVENERNHLQVLTTDTLVDGVHVDRRFTPPAAIGHRALAVNLSDLAAMGARPRMVLLSMALPADLPLADFEALADGFGALAAAHHVPLVGGNLTRTPGPLTLDVTAIGSARRRQVLRRDTAKAGHEVYVTGTVGSARAGLACLQQAHAGQGEVPADMRDAVRAYLSPDPRVRAGLLAARNHAASACMDLSDGLADAVLQVAEASGVGMQLTAAALPIAAAVRAWAEARGLDPVHEALAGGDDYELLFTVPRRTRRAFLAALRLSGVAVTRLGVCTPEPGVFLDGTAVTLTGFRHFR